MRKRWIKSKVVVFFGLNNQFAGMYIVDNTEQVEAIQKLVYDYPYHYKIYDDIPRLDESVSLHMDYATGDIATHITDIDGVVKDVKKNVKDFMETNDFFEKIAEIFGNN